MGGMANASAAPSRFPRFRVVFAVALGLLGAAQANAKWGVSPEQALHDARRIIAAHADWSIYRGDGVSMAPRFDETHILIVEKASVEALKPGMVALFHDAAGDLVAHTVIACDGAGIVTRGLNNDRQDPHPISGRAVVGVLVGTLAAHSPIPEAFALPTALGKSY